MRGFLKNMGPGTLVAAAFIGPGTVTVCIIAGVKFGFSLLWVLGVAVFATLVLQEMAARIGLITQKGLADIVRGQLRHPVLRILVLGIIILAIILGNAAYEAGNISGAVLGLEAVFGSSYSLFYVLGIGLAAFILLYTGSYKTVERTLVVLVLLMSISFVLTALFTKPSIYQIIKGLFVPSLPETSLLTVAALVGTTVVPYNLFLHTALVQKKWKNAEELPSVRKDTFLSIILGGMVSMAILITATALFGREVNGAADLALALEPLYGSFSRYFLGFGLLAAGITSAVTAPLAAALVARECFGWENTMQSKKFRLVWMVVLLTGVLFSSLGIRPILIIQFAQVANGILLPFVAFFLLWLINKQKIMGAYTNSYIGNIFALLVLLFSVFLGLKAILSVV